MPATFLLLLSLPIALIGLIVGLAIWVGGDRSARRRGMRITGCMALPFFLLLAVSVGVPTLAILRPATSDFTEAFGWPPGPEFTNLRGETQAESDFRSIYLAFDGSPQARAALESKMAGAKEKHTTDFVDSLVDDEGTAPDWFKAGSELVSRRRCVNRKVREFDGWKDWDDFIVVDCLSDRHIYVLAASID